MDDEARSPKAPGGDGPLPLASLIASPEQKTSRRFPALVRARIERRLLLSHIATGLGTVPVAVALEFLLVGLEMALPRRGRRLR